MGATRAQLIRQFLTETAVFCVLAALLGVFLAVWSLAGIQHLLANNCRRTPSSRSIRSRSPSPSCCPPPPRSSSASCRRCRPRASTSPRRSRTRRAARPAARACALPWLPHRHEVALSVVLLVGSGLLLASFIKLQSTPRASRCTASPAPSSTSRRSATRPRPAGGLLLPGHRAVARQPAGEAAAATLSLPISGFGPRGVYAVEGRPIPPTSQRAIAAINFVSEDYFALLQIPLQAGRLFAPTDLEKSPGVVVINASFAKRLFPDKSSAVGQVLLRGQKADIKLEIVGIGAT